MTLPVSQKVVAIRQRLLNISKTGVNPISQRNTQMRPISKVSRVLVLPFVVLALVACEDDVTAPLSAGLPIELQQLEQGIHPVLSIPALDRTGGGALVEIYVHLRSVGVEGPVASYQGEFRFDPDALSVVEGRFPEGLLGAWNEVEPGLIRFAGISLEGLGDGVALTLTVDTHRALAARDFQINIEEVVRAEGFTDLTDQVVRRDAPILTRTRFDAKTR